MGTRFQAERAHAMRKLDGPCMFCRQRSVELWHDVPNAPHGPIYTYQVRCSTCGARGPWADCGEESAVVMWEDVQAALATPPPSPKAPEPAERP